MSLINDAMAGNANRLANEEQHRLEENQILGAMAEAAFVKRFGYAPEIMELDQRILKIEGLNIRYDKVKSDPHVHFEIRDACPGCGTQTWEEVFTVSDIGRILEQGIGNHWCDSSTQEPAGPEDKLITALADFVSYYAPEI